jgi:nucleoside-diphosphate-sugar epimerase
LPGSGDGVSSGFHPDNPVGMTEAWPARPAQRLFYAQEKAELEEALQREAAAAAKPALYLVRPPIVLGPHAMGAKGTLPGDCIVTGADVARELGLAPVALPAALLHSAARAAAALPKPPLTPPAADWVEAFSHPAIMDVTKARAKLGWRPRYSGLEALRETVRSGD